MLRALSYNVFFDEKQMHVRMRAIGALIKRYKPTVIALQELTLENFALLKAQVFKKTIDF